MGCKMVHYVIHDTISYTFHVHPRVQSADVCDQMVTSKKGCNAEEMTVVVNSHVHNWGSKRVIELLVQLGQQQKGELMMDSKKDCSRQTTMFQTDFIEHGLFQLDFIELEHRRSARFDVGRRHLRRRHDVCLAGRLHRSGRHQGDGLRHGNAGGRRRCAAFPSKRRAPLSIGPSSFYPPRLPSIFSGKGPIMA